jgi:cell division cycle protein 20 (cofactor of APC complex)
MQQEDPEEGEDGECLKSPSQVEKERAMSENLHGRDINTTRVLAFQKKAPGPPDGYQNALKVVYSQSKTPHSAKHPTRYIPQAPDRILDAPDIVDDYCEYYIYIEVIKTILK